MFFIFHQIFILLFIIVNEYSSNLIITDKNANKYFIGKE